VGSVKGKLGRLKKASGRFVLRPSGSIRGTGKQLGKKGPDRHGSSTGKLKKKIAQKDYGGVGRSRKGNKVGKRVIYFQRYASTEVTKGCKKHHLKKRSPKQSHKKILPETEDWGQTIQ